MVGNFEKHQKSLATEQLQFADMATPISLWLNQYLLNVLKCNHCIAIYDDNIDDVDDNSDDTTSTTTTTTTSTTTTTTTTRIVAPTKRVWCKTVLNGLS